MMRTLMRPARRSPSHSTAPGLRWLADSWSWVHGFMGSWVRDEHYLTRDLSVLHVSVSAGHLLQRKTLRDDRLELTCCKQIEKGGEVCTEPVRLSFLQPLYVIKRNMFPVGWQ